MRERTKVRYIMVCLCSYLCVFALGKIVALNGNPDVYWGGSYFGYNLMSVLLFGLTSWLLNRFVLRCDRRQKVLALIGGVLLSLAIVYGAYAHYTNNIFSSTKETLQQLLMIAAICVLTAPLFSEVMELLNKASVWFWSGQAENVSPKNGRFAKWTETIRRHPALYFVGAWISIFLCYLPLFLAWWPGNFVFDAKYQIRDVIRYTHSTHHPLIHTLMMGEAYELGLRVGNVSWGYQFYTLVQMLILASAFAYALLYLYKKQIRAWLQVAAWAFFALFPMNALFAISSTKDVLCAAFFLYFMVFLVRLLMDKEEMKLISYVGMVISGALLSLFRNNAMYAVLIVAVLMLIFVKGWKSKGKTILIFAAIYFLSNGVNDLLIAATDARSPDTYRETLSVPMQCMARVANYRRDDLADELYAEICQYIPEGNIASYNPYNSDAVKNTANEILLRTNTVNFFKLWVKLGLQFPDEYLESIITNTLGYWYPLNQGTYVSMDIALYHTLIEEGEEIEKVCYCKWAEDLYSSLFWTGDYKNVPLLGYSFRTALYVWIVILFTLWSIYKRNKESILVSMLPFVYFLTCLCGPAAALRYIYCLVVCVPLFVYLALRTGERREKE